MDFTITVLSDVASQHLDGPGWVSSGKVGGRTQWFLQNDRVKLQSSNPWFTGLHLCTWTCSYLVSVLLFTSITQAYTAALVHVEQKCALADRPSHSFCALMSRSDACFLCAWVLRLINTIISITFFSVKRRCLWESKSSKTRSSENSKSICGRQSWYCGGRLQINEHMGNPGTAQSWLTWFKVLILSGERRFHWSQYQQAQGFLRLFLYLFYFSTPWPPNANKQAHPF